MFGNKRHLKLIIDAKETRLDQLEGDMKIKTNFDDEDKVEAVRDILFMAMVKHDFFRDAIIQAAKIYQGEEIPENEQ